MLNCPVGDLDPIRKTPFPDLAAAEAQAQPLQGDVLFNAGRHSRDKSTGGPMISSSQDFDKLLMQQMGNIKGIDFAYTFPAMLFIACNSVVFLYRAEEDPASPVKWHSTVLQALPQLRGCQERLCSSKNKLKDHSCGARQPT